MSRQTALHLPKWLSNPYQQLLADGLSNAGWDVIFENFADSYFALTKAARMHPSARVLHIHWTEPLFERYLWSASPLRFRLKSLAMVADIWMARGLGKRIIWTVHNEVAHESRNISNERQLNDLLARAVSHLVFHSNSAREVFQTNIRFNISAKSSVVPHGNYHGCYPPSDTIRDAFLSQFKLVGNELIFLIFGGLRRYKGIPELMRGFSASKRCDIRLIVAGSSFDDELTREITALSQQDPRIFCLLRYTDDSEVAPLLSISNAMLFGFERTLTSGSVMLAMTHGLATVLPERARVIDIADDEGSVFFADTEALTQAIDAMGKDELRMKGEYNRVKSRAYDWDTIGASVANIYTRP